MNCQELHREAILALSAVLLLRSPLVKPIRRFIVTLARALDDLEWAPQLVELEEDKGWVKVSAPLGWVFEYNQSYDWVLRSRFDFYRRRLRRLFELRSNGHVAL